MAIIAHSLGGVIALDLATAEDPLWTSRLVTFGSQAALFHACDPRGSRLGSFDGETPVALPASIPHWTNIWEPLDPLAFLVAPVFRLPCGHPPEDVSVTHQASAGWWTHSAYWQLKSVAQLTLAALDEPHGPP